MHFDDIDIAHNIDYHNYDIYIYVIKIQYTYDYDNLWDLYFIIIFIHCSHTVIHPITIDIQIFLKYYTNILPDKRRQWMSL